MSNSLVSIIIPTYNRAHLISETLDSIIAQIYTNWECIIVDDGSTDETEQLINNYIKKETRFQYHKRPSDSLKGANACRNYGFEISKGDYIQWFDSDDLMDKDTLRIKLEYAFDYNADIVIATHTTEKVIKTPINPKIESFESSSFYINYILGEKPVITNDVFIKRTVIADLRFDEKLHKAQEYEFFTRLFEQKLRYCFIGVPLTLYRVSDNSISKQTSKGNVAQVESLIYLSKTLQNRHKDNLLIVEHNKRLGRKMYKSIVLKNKGKILMKHFSFFKKCYNKNTIVFSFFLIYNVVFKRGFDFIKPRKS